MSKNNAENETQPEPFETSEPKDSVKCDNHPDRDGHNFTGDGAFSINLCEECTPSWFKD